MLMNLNCKKTEQAEKQVNKGPNIVKDISLDYSTSGGAGSATIITTIQLAAASPEGLVLIWEDVKGTGTINYYVSRDNGVTWQSVLESQKGDYTLFTGPTGTQVRAKAVMTGNAKLYGWSLACNEDLS